MGNARDWRRQVRGRLAVLAAVIGALLLATGSAGAQQEEPPTLQREGRWMVDQHGRVVLTHGVNLVWKLDPFYPPNDPSGFGAEDADWLVEHGFTSARVGTLWVGVTPEAPDHVDTAYLDAWDRVVQLLADRGIWVLFDFHQDQLYPEYQGEGVPEYAVQPGPSTTVLGNPMFGFPFNYFTPQVSEAFDNLWAAGPGSDAWEGYRTAWTAVAEALGRPALLDGLRPAE